MTPHMEREIYAQAEAWRSALEAVDRVSSSLATVLTNARGREVRFVGSGSSYYLGVAAAPVWGRRGWMARAVPSAEQLLHSDAYPTPEPPLAIGVSRSGTTTEVLRALQRMRDGGSPTLGVTTRVGTPMDDVCDVVVHVEGAQESSTVQTRSFSAQFIAAQAIAWDEGGGSANRDALRRLPDLADAWIRAADAHVTPLASRFHRVYVLGTGMRWGLALEGALKLKETSRTESEAFQTLEFRHGPKSMIDPDTLVVGLLGRRTRNAEIAVLDEMRALGAHVATIGSAVDGPDALALPGEMPEEVEGALLLPPLQLLAYRRGVHKGLDPDHPRHLSFAVELDGM